MGFSQAVLVYVMAYYFKVASGMDSPGVFYLISYSILLVTLLNFHKIIKKFGKSATFYFSFLVKITAMTLLIILGPSPLSIVALIAYIIFANLSWVGLDNILESLSIDRMSGRIRGLYLTIVNAGFVFGPFISTRLLDSFDFSGIFMTILLLDSVIFIIALIGLRNINHEFNQRESVLELVKRVLKRKNVMYSYYTSFTLHFFYALMVIYTPLYLLSLGIGWKDIGIIFSVMLIPFVLLQYPAGRLADKEMGEKELIILALFLMGVSTLTIYFINSSAVAVWAIVLFSTRIGAALLEILSDSYFYKRIDGGDVDIINFFRTARSVAYITASAVSVLFLFVFPLKTVFLLVAAVVFSALYPAFRLADNMSEKEAAKN
ncbi:putative MFS family transporter protein [bacterium BMS3Abin15]|nr:putative MFS family transporter protein [bacterium BMS3Abin15]